MRRSILTRASVKLRRRTGPGTILKAVTVERMKKCRVERRVPKNAMTDPDALDRRNATSATPMRMTR